MQLLRTFSQRKNSAREHSTYGGILSFFLLKIENQQQIYMMVEHLFKNADD
jgi:hypothetical protein